jgi:hypothetical protein
MLTIRWVKRIGAYAIVFARSIPGPEFTLPRVVDALERLKRLRKEIGPKDDKREDDERKQLQKIHVQPREIINKAEEVADYYADHTLLIRRLYPDNIAPAEVDNQIQASDAARQEVKQLQGS